MNANSFPQAACDALTAQVRQSDLAPAAKALVRDLIWCAYFALTTGAYGSSARVAARDLASALSLPADDRDPLRIELGERAYRELVRS